MSELTRRVLFAVVAAPLAVVIIYFGDAPLATLLAAVAALGAWEFCRLARAAGAEPFEWAAIVLAAAVPLAVHGAYNYKLSLSVTQFAVAALLIFAATIFLRGPERRPLLSAATTIFGVGYVSMLTYLYVIRYHDYVVNAVGGTALVMLPVLLTWASDIGGYMFGRMFGKRKLIPSVSPGKTVAGAIGGVVLTVVVCAVYVLYVLHPLAQLAMTIPGIVIFGVLISVIAQVGDLAESLIKREAGIKDSSNILPGHGGILDRFDSMLFVLPAAQLLLHVLLLPAPM
jgi:phosphatidate cytidylyltransferase